MNSKTIIEMDLDDMKQAFQEVLSETLKESFYKQFSNRLISSNTVCEVLGICRTSLSNYINDGRITPIDPKARYFKFELSDILKVDIKKFARISSLKFKRMRP